MSQSKVEVKIKQGLIIDASEASILLNCSRPNVERLQLKGLLKPVSTIYPKYYFDKNEVIDLKKSLTSKKNKIKQRIS